MIRGTIIALLGILLVNDAVGISPVLHTGGEKKQLRAPHAISKATPEHAIALPDVTTEKVDDVPADKRGEYYRPVSVTLWCVMTLTIASLCIYTALALARNSDELNGRFSDNPSAITDILATASRSALFAPMMCMLFVGCRMYVLATTEGLGEPPRWVKACMITATAGVCLQFILALILPLCTNESSSTFQALSGEHSDAHPSYHAHKFKVEGMKYGMIGAQWFTMLAIYGGVTGVIVGILTYPAQTTKISAAVLNTVILSGLYFLVFFLQYSARTRHEVMGSEYWGVNGSRFVRASRAMSMPVRKAPMMCVIFLAARMRALQLDPPYGVPPLWAQICFYSITASIFLETAAAAVVGITGREEKAYYGIHLYMCESVAPHAAMHFCALVGFVLLAPVTMAIVLMEAKNGEPAPLSPAVKSTLMLGAIYFGIQFAAWVCFVCKECVRMDPDTIHPYLDTVLAAGVSVTIAPLLSILFVACRMRALQITQQMGSPQGWAQDCMYLCVFAMGVQVASCLLLPIFLNSATEVDGDGNPEIYDLRPMIGAYAVTVVKYVALFCLHGGVITICVAVFTMTPETANRGERAPFDARKIVELLGITLLVVCLSLLLSSAKVVGLAVKYAIEAVDTLVLGTKICVGKAALSACEGYVNVQNLKIMNPEAEDTTWTVPHLLNLDVLRVKIGIWKLVSSLGKTFDLTAIILQGVNVTVEKQKGKKANVELIVDHLNKQFGLDQQQAAPAATSSEPGAPPPPPPDTVTVGFVSIKDITAAGIYAGHTLHLKGGDLEYANFSEEAGSGKGAGIAVGKLISMILQAILRTIMSNLKPGALIQQGVSAVTTRAKAAIGKLTGGGAPAASAADADDDDDDNAPSSPKAPEKVEEPEKAEPEKAAA